MLQRHNVVNHAVSPGIMSMTVTFKRSDDMYFV